MSDFPSHPYPWQLSQWQQLGQQIAAKKLPHALMFAGAKGIGKRHLAEALAHLLLCVTPIEDVPCGKCRGCQLNRVNNHPDYIVLTPEDGAKSIKVDQVRALLDDLSKTSQQGGYKVVVLEPAEAMNANAANALLKSLEEPAANTLLMLVCHSPSAVLPTIRSRCQLRLMPTPQKEQVIHWLKPLMAGSNIAVEKLLDAAGGAPLTALSYLEGDSLERRETWMLNLTRLSSGQISAVEVAAQWQKEDVIVLVEWFLVWLHSLMCWQQGVDVVSLDKIPQDFRERLKKVPASVLHRYIEKILQAKRQLLGNSNPNKQLLLEEMLLDWCALLRAGK
jgi:DNA polymerase-3 subunit delta'